MSKPSAYLAVPRIVMGRITNALSNGIDAMRQSSESKEDMRRVLSVQNEVEVLIEAEHPAPFAYLEPETLNSCEADHMSGLRERHPGTYDDWFPVWRAPDLKAQDLLKQIVDCYGVGGAGLPEFIDEARQFLAKKE